MLFAAGAINLDEARAAHADGGDLLTTLLRRGDEVAAAALAQSPGFRMRGRAFYVWPALDFGMPPDYAQRDIIGSVGVGTDSLYPLSRDAGVAPPPWWQWRTAWTRSASSRALRGELNADGS